MKIIVTAGATRERIDAVRSITNDATGKLGSLVAEELSQRLSAQEHTIYFICGTGSLVPAAQDIRVIRVEGTQDLQTELKTLLQTEHIDAVIHSMAVSDYTVCSITTPELIAERATQNCNGCLAVKPQEELQSVIKSAVLGESIDSGQKISSELEHPVLVLQRTPKIIGEIKEISPETVLVGFKLLSGVSEKQLIDTAYHLLIKNKCDFVLANDTDSIKDGNHKGFFIDASASVIKFEGKENIAKGIADNLLKKLSEDVE